MTARILEVVVQSMVGSRFLSLDQHLVDVEYDKLPFHWMPGLAGITSPEFKSVTLMNAGGLRERPYTL